MFKVNNKDTRTKSLTIDIAVVFLLLTLNIFQTFSSVAIVDFEIVNVYWEGFDKLCNCYSK